MSDGMDITLIRGSCLRGGGGHKTVSPLRSVTFKERHHHLLQQSNCLTHLILDLPATAENIRAGLEKWHLSPKQQSLPLFPFVCFFWGNPVFPMLSCCVLMKVWPHWRPSLIRLLSLHSTGNIMAPDRPIHVLSDLILKCALKNQTPIVTVH